ncbi:MAG TPA: HAMP domain-containing sensor histidine kinase [Kofleriaceae bacterium]|nr:HAMP domain-containing sensor histidine kinase [Kofleriaceae bacterium]
MTRAPANVQLRRAHLVLMLAGLVPTVAMTAVGIMLLALGSGNLGIAAGVLVLAFCTSAVTGYILGSVFLSRGASVARFQNDYLSAVSHELNTPITSVRMFIDTLQHSDQLDAAETKKCLHLLDQEMQRLDGLVARLFELSRMETGRHRFARERVEVERLIEEALQAFDAATLSHPIEVAVDIAPNLEIEGDREALAQALVNLLINAWKYTGDHKEIALRARREGRWITLSVRDNGQGIPAREHRSIFGQFERGKAAMDGPAQGAGLGLAIVRAIVRGNRGKIDVQSYPGQGSEFQLRLRPYAKP